MSGIRFWIWSNLVLVAGGWLLGWTHELNAAGYLGLLACWAVGAWKLKVWQGWRLSRWRFRQTLPRVYLLLLLLAFLSGALARPEFADALAYRTPRVAHWLSVRRWEWIQTEDDRKNNRGAAFEWMTAPLLLFTRTDRTVFLINIASYALLPGMIFAFLRGEKVRGRVAWNWAWVLAGATGPVLQAASTASDLHSLPLLLGGVVLARRGARRGDASEVGLSLVAVLLPSAVKAYSIVLLAPWVVAVWPVWARWRRDWWKWAAWAPAAALCSLLPAAWLNLRYTGDWTGLRRKPGLEVREYAPLSPGLGIVGNAALLLEQNLTPPLLPASGKLQALADRAAGTALGRKLQDSFEQTFFTLPLEESVSTAGLGLAVMALLAATFAAGCGQRAEAPPLVKWGDAGVWTGLAVFMAKAGAQQAGRLALPFYIPLLAPLLRGSRVEAAARRRWWQRAAGAAMLYPAAILLLARGGPLLPWHAGLELMARSRPQDTVWSRGLAALRAHEERADLFKEVRDAIPAEEREIGLIAEVTKEATLWLPIGSRMVRGIVLGETPDEARAQGLRYVVLPSAETAAHWQARPAFRELRDRFEAGGELVRRVTLPGTLSQDAEVWLVIRLRP